MKALVKKFGIVALAAAAALGCTDESTALKTLDDAGYKDATTEGYVFFGCGKDDQFHTAFTAKNPNGKTVHGVVCNSFLKGGTIRSL